MTIPTFYSPYHAQHAPKHEFLHGQLVPYFEMPDRIEAIKTALLAADLIDLQGEVKPISTEILMQTHEAGLVTYLEEMSHTVSSIIYEDFKLYEMTDRITGDEYFYEWMFPPPAGQSPRNQRKYYVSDSTSPFGTGTWQAVHHSASIAQAAAQTILNGEKLSYALCRPPGHHAGKNFVGGYCYQNNAAIAANALTQHGKVAILDIDYHHGNGTQDIFWDNPDVLFVSIHADPNEDYPYYAGYNDETGGEAASNTNLNLPLPHGSGEATYLEALQKAIDTIQGYNAQSVVISLGFDTFVDDPMAHFELNIGSYHKLGAMISNLNLPTVYIQEGGYAIDSLGKMAVSFFNGVLGR